MNKLESNDGYDWISEIFPRHFFSKGTDYFKILQNLETLIKQVNYYNSMNHDQIHMQNSAGQKDIPENISDNQENGKNKNNHENFVEENTCQNEDESMGSPNNMKYIKKKLSGSTIQCIHKNSTATASYDENNLDAHDSHNFNTNQNDNMQIQNNEHDIMQKSYDFEDQTIDIYDVQREIRLTSLNKIFSIFILNISSRISQPALIEILVFITLFRKALNEKGWEMCSSPLPFDHFKRFPMGQNLSNLNSEYENAHLFNNQQFLTKNKKYQNNNKKQSDNVASTAESSATTQSKKGSIENDIDGKQSVLQEDDEVEHNDDRQGINHIQNQNNQEENNISSGQKSVLRNKIKIENNSEQKQQQNLQYEFCEYNCGQRVSEIANNFIADYLPQYFKTAISNANELHVIGPSEEGMKNSCYIMQLFINWMFAFKFSESKLVFSDDEDEIDLKENSDNQDAQDIQKKRESKQSQKGKLKQNQHDYTESSHNAENDLNTNQDISHDNLEGRISGRFNNNLSNDHKSNRHNQFNSLYDELDDESKENRQTGNQYDLEMIGSRKQRKHDLDDHHGMLNDNFSNNGNNFSSMHDAHYKLNGIIFPGQMYQGNPHYINNSSAVNSTSYANRNYRFFEPSSTSFYNSGNNSTTFYNSSTPFAYYNRTNYNSSYHNIDTFPKSTKFGDQDTPKINGYPNPLSMKVGSMPMMYGNGYVTTPTSQYGFPMINTAIYPQIQPTFYPQQQAFLSPHQVINSGSTRDLFNQMGNNTGQSDFS